MAARLVGGVVSAGLMIAVAAAAAEEGGKTETVVEVTEARPGDPNPPAESAKPPDPAKPPDAAPPAEPAKPVDSGKAAVPAKPTDAPKADAGKPAVVGPTSDEDREFNLKLRGIEERVNELKEKIFQSKARLVQLQEVVMHGGVSGAKAVLVHRNEMGDSFRLRRVQYALDGAPIFNRVDSGTGDLNDQEEIEIFNGSIAPGNHQLAVYLEYQGHGYGVFSYLKGYAFKIKSSYTFDAEEGKLTTVRIIGYEKGGITTELKDRPSVEYKVERTQALRPAVEPGEAGSPP